MDALTVTVQVCHVDCGKGNELNWWDTFADGEDVGCKMAMMTTMDGGGGRQSG